MTWKGGKQGCLPYGDCAGDIAVGRVDAEAGGEVVGGVDDAAFAGGGDGERADRGAFGGGLIADAVDGDRAVDVPEQWLAVEGAAVGCGDDHVIDPPCPPF